MDLASESLSGVALNDSKQRRFWKQLWKINTPHKVRHFAWRACKDILPTKENLVRRKVLVVGSCEMCQSSLEMSGHLFWECEWVREAWAMLKIFPVQSNIQFHSFMDMLWYGVFVVEWAALQVERMVIMAWALWTSRNEVQTGGAKKNVRKIVDDALEYLAKYQVCVEEPNKPRSVQHECWKPPSLNKFKINIDGAVFASQKTTGVSVLVRDAAVKTIGALSKKIWASLKAIEVEVKAVETGLQFAKDLLIHDFILESDSLLLTNALKELSPPLPTMAAIIYYSLSISREFRQVEFSHVRRQGNKLAHLLAKYVHDIDDFSIWLEEDPCFIIQALLQYVNNASMV